MLLLKNEDGEKKRMTDRGEKKRPCLRTAVFFGGLGHNSRSHSQFDSLCAIFFRVLASLHYFGYFGYFWAHPGLYAVSPVQLVQSRFLRGYSV